MHFDVSQLDATTIYKLLSGAVVPRPIAWITSQNQLGLVNLAPFSFFNAVSSNPPMIVVAIEQRGPRAEKDTLTNIRAKGSFVVHVVSEELAPAMVISAAEFPADVSEADTLGLDLAASHHIEVPRLVEAPISMECRLAQLLAVGDATLVIASVVAFHVQDELWGPGGIAHDKLQAVGRMAGKQYARTRELLELPAVTFPAWQTKESPDD